MSKKIIFLINQYATTPDLGIGGRHYSFSKYLVENGYEVYLVTSTNNHFLREGKKISSSVFLEKLEGINIVWIKTKPYSSSSGLIRIMNWIVFSLKMLLIPFYAKVKPKCIIYSSPSLIGVISALALSKFYRSSFVFEIRDIWPKTLCKIGGFSEGNVFIKVLKVVEYIGYRYSDHIISNLPLAHEHIKECAGISSKFSWLPNGYSKSDFYSNEVSEKDKQASISNNFVVGYCGTLGNANALEYFIEAARLLKKEDVEFILVGEGAKKNDLLKMVQLHNLKNVRFLPSVPKRQVASILSSFDTCFIGWYKSELYEYGIAANKMCEYMLSGRPIIHSYSGASDPVSLYNCGISVPAEDSLAIANAILKLKKLSILERDAYGKNGVSAAKKDFDYEIITKRLIAILEGNKLLL